MPPRQEKQNILAILQHFREGWGGVPESVLLFARYAKRRDVAVDALTRDGLYTDVGNLQSLPTEQGTKCSPWQIDITSYASIYFAGSFNILFPIIVGRAKRHRIRTMYAPKGNLCRIEFTRTRDVKKFVYLCLIEGIGLRMCDALMLSSKVERDNLLPPRWLRPRMETSAAEPFLPVESSISLSPPFSDRRKHRVLGFIAEIAPRKGLLELAEGFVRWVNERQLDDVELWIAGEARPGSEGYCQTCRDVLSDLEGRGLVRWLGAQRGEARTRFYGSIDTLVVPSQLESYGLTALESLAHGRPAICAPRVGVLEYLPHSPAVIRLSDLAPDAFLAAFDELLLTDTEGYKAAVSGMIEEIFTDSFQEKITDEFFHALAITS